MRVGKIEFPKFRGDDFEDWLFRCEQFFQMDGTPEEAKLKIVVIHLEGRALHWHQSFMGNRDPSQGDLSWEEYKEAISARFNERPFEDPLAEL